MTKLLWRDIRASLGRFIAIALIILLGVLIFVGVKATGPGLIDSAETALNRDQLADVQVTSTKGFTSRDVQAAQRVAGAQVEKVKFKTVLGGRNKDAVALYGYTTNHGQNRLQLTSGHLPTTANELVLDQRAKRNNHYRLGDQYTFAKDANLKKRTYKIVGFANSPLYIDNTTRGATNIGTGQIAYFAYLPANQLNLPVATLLNIHFKSLQSLGTFTGQYKHAINQKVTKLKPILNARAAARKTELIRTGNAKLAPTVEKLSRAQKKLTAAKQLARTTSQKNLLRKQQAKLDRQKAKLTTARKNLAKQATPTYNWTTREDLAGFSAYGQSADRIAAIANVFPVFFFLIAALITFTTVTRMVEEARMQIGTFKALGFSNLKIAGNYLAYAFLAGLLGIILGAFIGNQFLPRFVISIYKGYIFTTPIIHYQWNQIGLATIFALVATVGAAGYVILRQINDVPATLMRPKAPKSAKRILLERFTWLWSKLKFYQKISYRNLFRFKSRSLMTILGIAGGTALILTGFGIADSIGASSQLQFSKVIHYQAVVQATSENQLKSVKQTLANSPTVRSSTPVSTAVVKAKSAQQQLNDINLYVPQKPAQFSNYLSLRSTKTNHQLSLPKNGAILSQKVASTLKIKKGDHIRLIKTNGHPIRIKVAGIIKNYIGHFIYLSPAAYRSAFKTAPTTKTLFVRLNLHRTLQRTKLSQQWLSQNRHILGVSFTADQKKTVNNMSAQMNPVVLIFILLSGILSFVVLYNLTNINISERVRELSTIKVLGFFNREVTMYVARENIVLAVVGILVGFGLGNLLTQYVLHQAETSLVVFPLTIHFQGYLVATVLMIGFNLIVIYVAHRHLKHVDMVAALKANE